MTFIAGRHRWRQKWRMVILTNRYSTFKACKWRMLLLITQHIPALLKLAVTIIRLYKHDAVTWSAIISAHVLHGFGQEALNFFGQMQLHVNEIDNVTFLSVFKACSLISALNQGRLIHSQVVNTEWESDANVGNSLIDMYSKCGSLPDSLMVFHSLPTKTVVTWNALIAGLANNNQYCLAFKLLKVMEQDGLQPNDITFSSLLSACNQHGMLHEGRCLFESLSINYGITPRIDHYTCLVGLLSYAGCLVDAACLVSILPLAPNLVTWTSMLSNSKLHGNLVLGKQASDNLMTINGHFAPAYALKLFADINLQGNAKNAPAA